MAEYNPNCGRCGMLNRNGFCSLTACAYPTVKYNADEFFNRKPMTNADRIRAMPDEELAKYLIRDVEAEAIRRAGRFLTAVEIDRAVTDCLDWLKSEVDNAT